MLRSLAARVRRRPKTTILLLTFVLLTGTGVGLYVYCLRQWEAAQVAVKKGRLEEAQRHLDLCLRVWPRSVPVHLLAARVARFRGDFEGAEAHLNQCLKLQKGATEATQLEFLLMRVQTGEVDEVAPVLMNCVENNHPETPLILETITTAYIHNLRFGPALVYLDRWVKAEPNSTQPLYWRGWVLDRLHDRAGARKDYQQALELDPDLVAVRLRMVEMYLEESNPPDALPHLERLMKLAPDRPDVKARLGQCRFLEGKREEARRLLEAAVEEMPNDPDVLITLAKLDMQESPPRTDRAEQWLRRVLKANPTDTEAQHQLIGCLQAQNRRDEAEALAIQHEKDKAMLVRANLAMKEEVLHPASNDAETLYEVGSFLLRSGQERQGVDWLHRALERDKGHQPTLKALAAYYERKGDRQKALAFRQQLTKPDAKSDGKADTP
jgi:tetratricopeptide (TPR) repeat protein